MQNQLVSAQQFFEVVVKPNFESYYNNQGDIRLAFNICVALNHLPEWIASESKIDLKKLIYEKKQENPKIEDIRNLTNTFKHCVLNEPKEQMSVGTSIAGLSILDVEDIFACDDVLKHGEGTQVIAHHSTNNEKRYYLVEAISSVYRTWKKHLGYCD